MSGKLTLLCHSCRWAHRPPPTDADQKWCGMQLATAKSRRSNAHPALPSNDTGGLVCCGCFFWICGNSAHCTSAGPPSGRFQGFTKHDGLLFPKAAAQMHATLPAAGSVVIANELTNLPAG